MDVPHDIINAYQSARLQYIRADALDEDFKAFVLQIEQDPVIQVLAAPTMLKPKGKTDFNSYAESVATSLLGVAVCLLPEEERKREHKGSADLSMQEPGEAHEDKLAECQERGKKPTIIGVMCLGWGGISPSIAHHRSAPIGISLAKPYQNKGYRREAIDWMLDWAFKHAGLHSVTISAASYNPRAIHLYQGIGFSLDGRRRETIWYNRGWHDELDFGMTEREWEGLRGFEPSRT